MCGNFGLLQLLLSADHPAYNELLDPLEILQQMAARTELRGGQAAGLSCLEWKQTRNDGTEKAVRRTSLSAWKAPSIRRNTTTQDDSGHAGGEQQSDDEDGSRRPAVADGLPDCDPYHLRVRLLQRKRYALADDLLATWRKTYLRSRKESSSDSAAVAATVYLGHTRFATSSYNRVPELHPHMWVPFRMETVWRLYNGRFQAMHNCKMGIQITHNGDFEALTMFNTIVTNDELRPWLSRVLSADNSAAGDSPKVAGMLDLLCTQGHWPSSVRLAYQQAVATCKEDASGGRPLSSEAGNTAPSPKWCMQWGEVLEEIWIQHQKTSRLPAEQVIQAAKDGLSYTINNSAVKVLVTNAANTLLQCVRKEGRESHLNPHRVPLHLPGSTPWSWDEIRAFAHHAIRNFLRQDLYAGLTQLLQRAEGSFGITAFSALEPGAVALAAKGQPMALTLSEEVPIVLFGSEGNAVSAPVFCRAQRARGSSIATVNPAFLRPLAGRIDMDERGEVMRVGSASPLDDCGSYTGSLQADDGSFVARKGRRLRWAMKNGITLRSYSLTEHCERSRKELKTRVTPLMEQQQQAAASPLSNARRPARLPGEDLVAWDLRCCTHVLAKIDKIWQNVDLLVPNASHVAGGEGAELVRDAMSKDNGDNSSRGDPARRGSGDGDDEGSKDGAVDDKSGIKLTRKLHFSMPTLRAAEAMGQRLLSAIQARQAHNHRTIDVLVAGIEASLWIAEQWVTDLKNVFGPCLTIQSISTNKLLGIGHHTNDKVFTSGCPSLAVSDLSPNAVILLVSQSGQTFPTLHATRLMTKLCPQGVFMLVGESNSKMEQAMIQVKKDMKDLTPEDVTAPRVLLNGSGHCPAEPTSMAAAATHHTLSRLLVFLLEYVIVSHKKAQGEDEPALGFAGQVKDADVRDMSMMLSGAVVAGSMVITGADESGRSSYSHVHEALELQGRHWAKHVKEPWEVLVFVGFYIAISVTLQLPILHVITWSIAAIVAALGGCDEPCKDGAWTNDIWLYSSWRSPSEVGFTLFGILLRFLDALIYIWSAYLFTLLKRKVEGRPLWARLGRRTLVIVDNPMVHQLSEAFVSKLFSMSYSFCGIDVHGGSAVDHFVHRFTHRVARGVLLAVGRPDGRLCTLTKTEATVLLAVKQASFIQNWMTGCEVFSISHNPFPTPLENAYSVTLVSNRRAFLDEEVYARLHLAKEPFTLAMLKSIGMRSKHAHKMLEAANNMAMGQWDNKARTSMRSLWKGVEMDQSTSRGGVRQVALLALENDMSSDGSKGGVARGASTVAVKVSKTQKKTTSVEGSTMDGGRDLAIMALEGEMSDEDSSLGGRRQGSRRQAGLGARAVSAQADFSRIADSQGSDNTHSHTLSKGSASASARAVPLLSPPLSPPRLGPLGSQQSAGPPPLLSLDLDPPRSMSEAELERLPSIVTIPLNTPTGSILHDNSDELERRASFLKDALSLFDGASLDVVLGGGDDDDDDEIGAGGRDVDSVRAANTPLQPPPSSSSSLAGRLIRSSSMSVSRSKGGRAGIGGSRRGIAGGGAGGGAGSTDRGSADRGSADRGSGSSGSFRRNVSGLVGRRNNSKTRFAKTATGRESSNNPNPASFQISITESMHKRREIRGRMISASGQMRDLYAGLPFGAHHAAELSLPKGGTLIAYFASLKVAEVKRQMTMTSQEETSNHNNSNTPSERSGRFSASISDRSRGLSGRFASSISSRRIDRLIHSTSHKPSAPQRRASLQRLLRRTSDDGRMAAPMQSSDLEVDVEVGHADDSEHASGRGIDRKPSMGDIAGDTLWNLQRKQQKKQRGRGKGLGSSWRGGSKQTAEAVAAQVDEEIKETKAAREEREEDAYVKSHDPNVRLAFSSRLDEVTRTVQDKCIPLQLFYDSRIASLDRYLAFCVTFHAMAADCCHPWFRKPWDISRSQSNLRVATTAGPISVSSFGGESGGAKNDDGESGQVATGLAVFTSDRYVKFFRLASARLRKVHTNF